MLQFYFIAIMCRHSVSTTLLAVVLACTGGLPAGTYAEAAPPGWRKTWGDEFNDNQIDATKWDLILWTTPFNNEHQAYHPSRVTVSQGNLSLTADGADFEGKSYTSGKVESKFAQQYGRWEVRAKLPSTQGTWPAIWLLPETTTYPWPSQGEIDIMENRGHQPHLTSSAYHWGANFQTRRFITQQQQAANGGQSENYHTEFHTYAVEWDARKLRFFVDGVHYQTISNAETDGFLGNQTAPMEINLNLAVGGDFVKGAQPDGNSSWPQRMLIDYVRVYQRDDSPPPAVLRNGSFEAQGGSLAGWSVFGNAVPNVQTHHEAAAIDGKKALKLFGQSNGASNHSGISQGISVSPGDSLSASASTLVRSADAISGANTVIMKLDYYSDFGGEFDSSSYLRSSKPLTIANAGTANDVWHAFSLTDTVPDETVEARLAFVFVQPGSDHGAVHIDQVRFRVIDSEHRADASVGTENSATGKPMSSSRVPLVPALSEPVCSVVAMFASAHWHANWHWALGTFFYTFK